MISLRRVVSDRNAGGGSFRAWAARVSGRADRRLLLALARATDAVAAHCDQLVDRLAAQEAVTADVAGSFGQELALLRAEVLHLQRTRGRVGARTRSREPAGSRRRRLPLARPSERTGLRDPVDRGSSQSRRPVAVLVPGRAESPRPTARSICEGWASPVRCGGPSGLSAGCDRHRRRPDAGDRVAAGRGTARPSVVLPFGHGGAPTSRRWRRLPLVGGDSPLGVHVPVNRLAEQHRHHGFGFTDYLLVLSDRTRRARRAASGGRLAQRRLRRRRRRRPRKCGRLGLEGAGAARQASRSTPGWTCGDCSPTPTSASTSRREPHIARECVEAMRFGTPIIVPARRWPRASARAGNRRRHLSGCVGAACTPPPPSGTSRIGRRSRLPLGGMPMGTTAIPRRWSSGSTAARDGTGVP